MRLVISDVEGGTYQGNPLQDDVFDGDVSLSGISFGAKGDVVLPGDGVPDVVFTLLAQGNQLFLRRGAGIKSEIWWQKTSANEQIRKKLNTTAILAPGDIFGFGELKMRILQLGDTVRQPKSK